MNDVRLKCISGKKTGNKKNQNKWNTQQAAPTNNNNYQAPAAYQAPANNYQAPADNYQQQAYVQPTQVPTWVNPNPVAQVQPWVNPNEAPQVPSHNQQVPSWVDPYPKPQVQPWVNKNDYQVPTWVNPNPAAQVPPHDYQGRF